HQLRTSNGCEYAFTSHVPSRLTLVPPPDPADTRPIVGAPPVCVSPSLRTRASYSMPARCVRPGGFSGRTPLFLGVRPPDAGFDGFYDILPPERLDQIGDDPLPQALHRRNAGIAGRQDHRGVRVALADSIGEPQAV